MVNPYDDRFTEYSQEKLVLKGKIIAEKCTNKKLTPQDIIDWLSSLNTEGWTNICIKSFTVPNYEDRLESEWILVKGDRLETDDEFKARQENIINKWKSDYENFLLQKNYYENTDLGKAQVAEVRKHFAIIRGLNI